MSLKCITGQVRDPRTGNKTEDVEAGLEAKVQIRRVRRARSILGVEGSRFELISLFGICYPSALMSRWVPEIGAC